jgi:hypothetical protein
MLVLISSLKLSTVPYAAGASIHELAKGSRPKLLLKDLTGDVLPADLDYDQMSFSKVNFKSYSIQLLKGMTNTKFNCLKKGDQIC